MTKAITTAANGAPSFRTPLKAVAIAVAALFTATGALALAAPANAQTAGNPLLKTSGDSQIPQAGAGSFVTPRSNLGQTNRPAVQGFASRGESTRPESLISGTTIQRGVLFMSR